MGGTGHSAIKRMNLRYAGSCCACGVKVPAGVLADYHRATKSVSCLTCSAAAPTDAEVAPALGGSAESPALETPLGSAARIPGHGFLPILAFRLEERYTKTRQNLTMHPRAAPSPWRAGAHLVEGTQQVADDVTLRTVWAGVRGIASSRGRGAGR